MVGGRIGKDGIHGATFSSLALDESLAGERGSARRSDHAEARGGFSARGARSGLYRAITDNGAGGLSSSVGELAQLSRRRAHGCRAREDEVSGPQALRARRQRIAGADDGRGSAREALARFWSSPRAGESRCSELGEFTVERHFRDSLRRRPVGEPGSGVPA